MNKQVLKCVLVLLLFHFCTGAAAEENYCIDQKSWEQWENLVAKYLYDMDLKMLYSMRQDLCKKVERGDIVI